MGIGGTDSQYLQKLQNKNMKIIYCDALKRVGIKDMLETLQLSIKERIEYNVCILVYKK